MKSFLNTTRYLVYTFPVFVLTGRNHWQTAAASRSSAADLLIY